MSKTAKTPVGMTGGVLKPYDQMTTAELREATKMYHGPLPNGPDGLPGKPLTAAQRKLHAAARKRGPGRPKIGKGVKMVLVTVESDLLKRADRYAKAHKLKRSQLITLALAEKIGNAPAA